MKSTLALLALAGAATGSHLTAEYVEANHMALFGSFKTTYARNYTSAAEEEVRRAVFKKNMLAAAEAQTRNPRATFGATKFSDMTEGELRMQSMQQFVEDPPLTAPTKLYSDAELAAVTLDMDWRQHGAVCPVQDQGGCGSCWAFSIVGALEAQNFLNGPKKELVKLSEQMICVCRGMGCTGSAGPWKDIDQLIDQDGVKGRVATEASWPYTGSMHHSNCAQLDYPSTEIGAVMKGRAKIANDEAQMAAWLVKNGPISISINDANWQIYTGGIMDDCLVARPSHAVLAVGITADYWIIKNSWGADWGESGYIRLAYGSNLCNIEILPTAPTV